MKLYVISINNKPATIEKLCRANGDEPPFTMDEDTKRSFIVDTSKESLISQYLFWFGFTWKERPKGVDLIPLRQAEEGSKRRQEKSVSNSNSNSAYKEAVKAVELFQLFFDKMPKGQLGKIVCDIGILNDAFIQARKVLSNKK